MNYGLLLEITTVLSIIAVIIPVLAAFGVFKSRRQREVEAALKTAMRQSATLRAQPAAAPLPAPAPAPAPLPLPIPMPTPSAQARDLPPAAANIAGQSQEPLLRPRVMALESTAGSVQASGSLRSTGRGPMQRRYRRTRCMVKSPQRGICPHCGYLL